MHKKSVVCRYKVAKSFLARFPVDLPRMASVFHCEQNSVSRRTGLAYTIHFWDIPNSSPRRSHEKYVDVIKNSKSNEEIKHYVFNPSQDPFVSGV